MIRRVDPELAQRLQHLRMRRRARVLAAAEPVPGAARRVAGGRGDQVH